MFNRMDWNKVSERLVKLAQEEQVKATESRTANDHPDFWFHHMQMSCLLAAFADAISRGVR